MSITPDAAPGPVPATLVVGAVDIGATSMRVALVDAAGRILARTQAPTEPHRGLEDATGRILALLRGLVESSGRAPVAVGVATAGPVDPASGTYRHPPNLPGWHARSMQPALTASLGVPVRVGHDATLAALAETRFGHRAGARDLVYLTVSTGIGAGIVAGGRPVTGHAGGAGEAGHLIVVPGGPACGAGCAGCLEGTASGSAIAAAVARRIEAGAHTSVPRGANAEQVFHAAAAGDAVAEEVVATAVRYLGAGIAGLLAVLDPEVLVVGGGVARGLEPRWPSLLAAVRDHALPRYREHVPVEPTTLRDDAGLLGAAVVALEAAA